MRPHPRRVLFVSYSFPPVGGVGVQRVTKFVKYLPEQGWNSSVLTVSNPSVPLIDETLARDIPPGTILRRAKTYEPGYALKQAVSNGTAQRQPAWRRGLKTIARKTANLLLQPDPQVLWHPQAYRTGLKLLRDVSHDAIIATGPPFSSFILGAKLSRATGLPLILDYRDEWDISNAYWENKGQGRIANWIQQRQQTTAIRSARMLLATSPSSTAAVAEIAHRHGVPREARCIYNGFDPADYVLNGSERATDIAPSRDRFRLAFIGTLWNLNSIEPVVTAIQRLAANHPHLASQLELLLAGRRTEEQSAIVDRLNDTPVRVERLPFVSHREAISLMQSADALLMLNSDLPQTRRIINAKTFEYMAAKRPMFVVAPRGDVWDLVRDLPGTVLCEPGNPESILQGLELMLEQHRCGIRHDSAVWNIRQYERRTLAGQLAEILDEVTMPARMATASTLRNLSIL